MLVVVPQLSMDLFAGAFRGTQVPTCAVFSRCARVRVCAWVPMICPLLWGPGPMTRPVLPAHVYCIVGVIQFVPCFLFRNLLGIERLSAMAKLRGFSRQACARMGVHVRL